MSSTNKRDNSRSRFVARVGLAIAIIAVSAWIVIPIGPVPFTMQIFAVTFVIVAMTPQEAIATIGGYLALGAIGFPVFSGMRGGIGVLLGPTGGFLWGYMIGVPFACGMLYALRHRMQRFGTETANIRSKSVSKPDNFEQQSVSGFDKEESQGARVAIKNSTCHWWLRIHWGEYGAALLFLTVAYICGWLQSALVLGISLPQAFLVSLAPFVIFDLVKVLFAVKCALVVRETLKSGALLSA